MADRSRWFESLSVPRLWRRVVGNDGLGVLRSNLDLAAGDKEQPIRDLPIRDNRTFPPDMPRPGAEYGATGTPIFGGFVSGEDYNPKMDGAKALLVFDEMRRSDAQVNATLRVLKQPLKAATWDIDAPDGSTDPADQAIADFCASALFDDDAMAHPWNFVLHHILLKLDFGVSLLEKIFTVGELGEIRYHRLAPRLPRTIFRWIIDPETGTLEAVVQFAPKGGAFQYLTIPAMYAAVFCHEREGDNYFGRSVLRTAYQHWWRKQQLYNLDSVRLDRYGVGIPRASILQGHRPTDQELANIKTILRSLRSHERGYVIQPFGVVFDILTPSGSGEGGAKGLQDSVNHQNFMIAANILAGFLNDPSASRGAKAHTQTIADIFQDSLQGIGDDTGGEILAQLVRPLCDLNFDMTGRKYPVVRVSGLDSVDGNALAVALQKLGPTKDNPRGFVTPDDSMEDWLRDQYNAPPRDLTDTVAPAASGGVASPSPSPTPAGPGTPGAAISSRPARATPAVSPAGVSRLAPQVPSTETGKGGQIVPDKPAVPDPKGDTGGSVVAAPLERPTGQPPMTEATSVPRPASPIAAGQPKVGPTSIELDPMVDHINAPELKPRGTLGISGPQGGNGGETAYGFGGPRKVDPKARLQAPWPEGPLSPVKPPPPPGGAMGAPPLGTDNAVGNNDGFPLGLKRDPVTIGGRMFGRAPTLREEQILNFREIPDRLDAEKAALVSRLRTLRQQQRDRLIADVVKRDADPKTGSFTDLRPDATPMPLANDVYLAIRAAQSSAAKYGALQVRSELQKQGVKVTGRGGKVRLAASDLRTVLFVRHGETDDDRPPERVSSNATVPLNATGQATAQDLARVLSAMTPLRIIASPLERAQETAAAIADGRSDATIITDPSWAPWYLGDLTGQTVDEAKPALDALQTSPDDCPPGSGESWHAFTGRIAEARQQLLQQVQPEGATVVVTHSWILKMTWQELQGQRGVTDPVVAATIPPGSILAAAVRPDGRVARAELLTNITADTPPLHLATPDERAAANKQKQISALTSSAQITAEKLNTNLKTSVLDAATRARRSGAQGADLAAAIRDTVDDQALDSGVAREVGQEINEAFGIGRNTEASALGDGWDTVVYSALMDNGTCDSCADLDGTEWSADDDDIVDTPNPDCDGRDNCRCVLLYVQSDTPIAARAYRDTMALRSTVERLQAQVDELKAAPTPAPVINITTPPVNVTAPPVTVTVEAAPAQPAPTVHVTLPSPAPMRKTVERDAEGRITGVREEPE